MPVLGHERASQNKFLTAEMGNPLSDASVVALRSLVEIINNAIALIDDCTLTADNSKAVDPMRAAKATELKCELEIAGVLIANYIECNIEHDSVKMICSTQALVDNTFVHCKQLCELVDAFHA
jgi:hypothetical protein